jgi:hypothetical protein
MRDDCAAVGSVATAPSRDVRIDFFRGLTLYMILIDHIQLNSFAKLTYHSFGFSDAAEIFVFLSGLSCGLAYSALLARRGPGPLLAALVRRAGVIYVYYLLASVATWLIVFGCDRDLSVGGLATNLTDLARLHWTAIPSIATLTVQPPLPSVLILYVVLSLCLVPPFLLAGSRHAIALLMVSGLLWGIAQLYPGPVPYFPYFNPFAWQFLFAIGLVCGLRYRTSGAAPPAGRMMKAGLALAWAIVLAALLFRLAAFVVKMEHMRVAWLQAYAASAETLKYHLSFHRLVHFLSVVLLVRTYVPSVAPLNRYGGTAITVAGRNALPVFAASAVLSIAFTFILADHHFGLLAEAGLNVLAVGMLATVALLMEALRAGGRRKGGPSRGGSVDAAASARLHGVKAT